MDNTTELINNLESFNLELQRTKEMLLLLSEREETQKKVFELQKQFI